MTSEKGTANTNHTAHTAALANKCLGHKYITTVSWSYVWYAHGIRSEFHIGMLVEKSTFQQRWGGWGVMGGGGSMDVDKVFLHACSQTTLIRFSQC